MGRAFQPYIVEHSGPSLHGDALEDSENSKQDVVKLRDAIIGAYPHVAAGVFGRTLAHTTWELIFRRIHRLVFCTGARQKKKTSITACDLVLRSLHTRVQMPSFGEMTQ